MDPLTKLQRDLQYIKKTTKTSFEFLQNYLEKKKIFLFLITKKMVGKSTYINYLEDLFPQKFINLSFGETIRKFQNAINQNQELIEKKFGPQITKLISTASVSKLLPLVAVEKIFEDLIKEAPPNISVLFDGLPREESQITLVNKKSVDISKQGYQVIYFYLDLIDPILDQRMESRRVCPQCGLVDNILTVSRALPQWNEKEKKVNLVCPRCNTLLERKKGDQLSPAVYSRRRKMEKIIHLLKENTPPTVKFISLRTEIPVNEFNGEDEDLNLINIFNFQNGKMEISLQRQQVKWQGQEYYSLAPRKAVALMIEKLAQNLS